MEAQWREHTLKVTGDWTGRWLFLAPEYELWLDDESLDRLGGPRTRPLLEGLYESDDGEIHHIEAELISIVGFKPRCDISVDGQLIGSDQVRVQNFINPFLMLSILVSTAIMLYVGPEVLRQFLPL